ncbi:rhamnose ABC transporter substrate-binding protein [Streptomyces sp. NPDC007818]|uniref:rhamnose ABC transporter substrate-binding protein n=1 Tax=Streptomyces sp. NPDC007818 TaxID=3364780 RepID=UPI0036B2E7E1
MTVSGTSFRLQRAIAALTAVSVTALISSSCGVPESEKEKKPNSPIKKGLTVAFLPKQVNNPYFATADSGGAEVVRKLGSTYKEVGTDSGIDTVGQISYIDSLIEEKVDAIVVSAQDPEALCPSLKEAMKKGISVVTYDSDTSKDCRNLFVAPAGAEDLGRFQAELISDQIGGEGQVAILSAAITAPNQNLWIDYMKDELGRNDDVEIVEVVYGDDSARKSRELTRQLLQKYPNLKGIVAPTTVGIKAAAGYLAESKYKGKVKLTGLGTPNDMRPYVKNGTVDSFVLWDPAKIGALAAHAAIDLQSGRTSGKEGEPIIAYPLGYLLIDENGVVTPGRPTFFDKKNIDDFDF